MGRQQTQQAWQREDYSRPAWQLWRGAKSPGHRPWQRPQEDQDWRHSGPSFPAFDAHPVSIRDKPPTTMPSWDEPEDPEGGMIHGLQAMLNSARQAEARMTKALNARARTTAQWNNFEEQLKRTCAKEKQRFAQITQKQDNDIAEAKAAQSTARAAVRQAYHNADADAQLPSKPSCASEWEALKAAWDQEQDAELGGVYRRAMLEDKITPNRGRAAAPRSPNPGQHPALTTTTDPYLAYRRGHLSSPTFLINFSAPHLGPQMEWISSTLSENNHTFLVCCGLWHEKPTFVASCGLMCPQNHTCVGRCGLVVASRACFPCKKSHPDPRTTRNFRHFRQGFKQDSKVRRLGRHFATPQYWDGIGAKASSNKASNTIPQYWDGV